MMSRHFGLSSELTGAIAKRLPHAKNQPSAPGSFFNQFVTDIYIYISVRTNLRNQQLCIIVHFTTIMHNCSSNVTIMHNCCEMNNFFKCIVLNVSNNYA